MYLFKRYFREYFELFLLFVNFSMTRYVIFMILGLVAIVRGYSGGAPEGVCDDMTPKHPVAPQKSAFPYTVSLNKKEVKGGENVEITISGGPPFKGYLLQVRDGDKAVGTFEIPATDKYSKTINCHGTKGVSIISKRFTYNKLGKSKRNTLSCVY